MSIWLFYWYERKVGKNLGDILSLLITREISRNSVVDVHACWIKLLRKVLGEKLLRRMIGEDVLHGIPADSKHKKTDADDLSPFPETHSFFGKTLFAVGSILGWGDPNCIYWGSGFLQSFSVFSGGIVKAVRGKLSKDKLKALPGWDTIAVGDPALLLPLWKKKRTYEKEYPISITPHYSETDFFKENYGEKHRIIDIRTDDIDHVIEEIQKSRYVLSSSLHGLILAHAYEVPALWIKHTDLGERDGVHFKFHDYFSSVDIPFYDGFSNFNDLLRDEKYLDAFFEKHKILARINCNLSQIQKGLLKSYPFALKKKYRELINAL
jgi:hypothetical protein